MASRLDLQAELESILGSPYVYFQPPASIQMHYPAIVYRRRDIDNKFADNKVYKQADYYEVTVIDKNPDSEFVRPVSLMDTCRFNRYYIADNLNHYVFVLQY